MSWGLVQYPGTVSTYYRLDPGPPCVYTGTMAETNTGRPREHDREHLMRLVCERVAGGELVKDVCASYGLNPIQPYKWAQDDEAFGKAYQEARVMQAHALAERIIEIAEGRDDLTELWENLIDLHDDELANVSSEKRNEILRRLKQAVIQRDTLRVNTLKWFVSKLAPKIYGDKLDLTSGGMPLPPQAVSVVFVNAPQGMDPTLLQRAQVATPGQLHAGIETPDAGDGDTPP